MDSCTAVGSRKISVDPHQIITTRSTVFLKFPNVGNHLVRQVALVLALLHVRAVRRFT